MARAAGRAVALALVVVVLSGSVGVPVPASGYPVLPIAESDGWLANLSAPDLDPGASGPLHLTLRDRLAVPIESVALRLEVYEYAGIGENASSVGASATSPTFDGPGASGSVEAIDLQTLAPGAALQVPGDRSVLVHVPSGTPSGTFAIRTSLRFLVGSTAYLLESRGFFGASEWANATILVNGTPVLNVSRLGTSGVLPETSVYVNGPSIAPTLYVLLGLSFGLAALGGYLAWRRGPGSSSGARGTEAARSAPSTFGKSRTSEGDLRST